MKIVVAATKNPYRLLTVVLTQDRRTIDQLLQYNFTILLPHKGSLTVKNTPTPIVNIGYIQTPAIMKAIHFEVIML